MSSFSVSPLLQPNVPAKLINCATVGQVAIASVFCCNRGGAGLQSVTLYVSRTGGAVPVADVVAFKTLREGEEFDKSGLALLPGESLWAMSSNPAVSLRAAGYYRPGGGVAANKLLVPGQVTKMVTGTGELTGSVMATNQSGLAAQFSVAISDAPLASGIVDSEWISYARSLTIYERYGLPLLAGQSVFVMSNANNVSVRAQFLGSV